MDPVRQDPIFQTFADRVGGREYRLYLEGMAQAMEGEGDQGIDPQLEMPKQEATEGEESLGQ